MRGVTVFGLASAPTRTDEMRDLRLTAFGLQTDDSIRNFDFDFLVNEPSEYFSVSIYA